jgi:hypothetical protein
MILDMPDKFRVDLGTMWGKPWPAYFDKFYAHCQEISFNNDWHIDTVANNELRPSGGKLIKTKTQGWYLRWNNEASHTAFVLKWS